MLKLAYVKTKTISLGKKVNDKFCKTEKLHVIQSFQLERDFLFYLFLKFLYPKERTFII